MTRKTQTTRRGFLALALGGMAAGTVAAGHASRAEAAIATPRQVSREVIQRILVEEAVHNRVVPPALALAVARVESNFQAHVTSSAGARGVMQIMPATGRGEFGVDADMLYDARVNCRLGVQFLERLYDQYGSRWDLALSHYNGGTLSRRHGQWVAHSYTREYVNNVMRFWNSFQRERWVVALVNDVRGGTNLVSAPAQETTLASDLPPSDPRVQAQMAADYAYLESPGTQRGWREYLQVADRYLDAAADANAGVAVDFSDIAVADPSWSYPLAEGGVAQTMAQAPASSAAGTASAAASSAPAAGGSDRFIYSGRFWRMALGTGKFN